LFGDAWSISDGGTLDSRRDAGAAAGTNAALLERIKQDSAIKQSLHNESAMILSISTAILCFFLRHGAQLPSSTSTWPCAPFSAARIQISRLAACASFHKT
jgi:hypothetical protein